MSFDKNELNKVDEVVFREISRIEQEKQNALKSYINGMQDAADLMYKIISKALESEATQ